MQKFLKGSSVDRLPPMPVVIGMTATPQRFKRLAEEISSTTHYVKTDTEDVRASGLLKDRIVVRYSGNDGNDMGVLQAATGEWVRMCEHWYQYCYEQHYGQVNPIFVIQVQNGNSHRVSMTDLDECLRVVEDCTGEHFLSGQVVHSFGEGVTTIRIGGLDVPYCEPSRIFDDKRIKVVFFKETLSTGWDCPRAEVMMSFRHAVDYTYIAQLLGRMIRTPTQQRINVDESLNDVYLFLPQFDRSTAEEVVKALRGEEGATIPSDIDVDEIDSDNYDLLGLKPTYKTPPHQSPHKIRASRCPSLMPRILVMRSHLIPLPTFRIPTNRFCRRVQCYIRHQIPRGQAFSVHKRHVKQGCMSLIHRMMYRLRRL